MTPRDADALRELAVLFREWRAQRIIPMPVVPPGTAAIAVPADDENDRGRPHIAAVYRFPSGQRMW
jgi:hypothetical protein